MTEQISLRDHATTALQIRQFTAADLPRRNGQRVKSSGKQGGREETTLSDSAAWGEALLDVRIGVVGALVRYRT